MDKIIHDIYVNVEDNVCRIKPPIDIHQGDNNNHIFLFHLQDSKGNFVNIEEDATFKIEFYLDGNLIISEGIVVDNYYRGLISYGVGSTITKNFGRYTTYLKMLIGDTVISTISFVTLISKTHDFSSSNTEVIITKAFYETLEKHLSDTECHLSEEDKDFLETLDGDLDALVNLIDIYNSWLYTAGGTYTNLVDIPIGQVVLTSDNTYVDYDGNSHTLIAPTYVFHSKDNSSNEDSIVLINSNDLVVYKQTSNSGKWVNLFDGTEIAMDSEMSSSSENAVQNKVIKEYVDSALIEKADVSTTYTKTEIDAYLADKQDTLVSQSNIKSINGQSILGRGDLIVGGGDVDTEMSDSSTNAVQNKVIKAYIDTEIDETIGDAMMKILGGVI